MKSTVLLLKVFEENYKTLFRIVFSITHDTEDTLDVLQEAFLRAYTHYNAHRSKEDTLQLLTTICGSTAKAYRKTDKKYEPLLKTVNSSGTGGPSSLEIFLLELKALHAVVPADLFDYLMMNILGGVPLLEVSRKSKIEYKHLAHWKKIVVKELSQRTTRIE